MIKNIKNLQDEVEKYLLNKNKKNPDSWTIKNDGDKIFYIEQSSGKKRYGVIKECEYCKRNFIVRKSWSETASVCSNYCGNAKKRKEVNISCSWCSKDIIKNPSSLKNSKHNLYFCNRECKENAQSIGGISKIQPSHYRDGTVSYSSRAFRHYGCKCVDCEITMKTFLEVHHKDGDRKNGDLTNLEVVCLIHHMLRHMKEDNNKWVIDFKSLTPRDKLEELRILLKK